MIFETSIKAGSDYVWLWVAIAPKDKMILGIRNSIGRSMLVAEQFIQSLIRNIESTTFQLMMKHGTHMHVDSLT
jgi:transposase-like protein